MPKFESDILLIVSGRPLPGVINIFSEAALVSKTAHLIIIEKRDKEIKFSFNPSGYQVSVVGNGVRGVSFQRVFATPRIYLEIIQKLKSRAILLGGWPRTIYCTSPDILIFAAFLKPLFRWSIRYDVRDLNSLSFSKGPIGWAYRLLEYLSLKMVDKMAISSLAFYDQYFKGLIKESQVFLTENVPRPESWRDFKKTSKPKSVVRVGMIGIIRYRKSVDALLYAAEKINRLGFDLRVILAGGKGFDCKDLDSRDESWLTQIPMFEYEKDIASIYKNVDIVFAVYEASSQNCRLAMPTKYYEAIITRTPILVSARTYVSKMVESTGIGKSIDLDQSSHLENTLMEVFNRNSWYSQALENLNKISIDPLRRQLQENTKKFIEY